MLPALALQPPFVAFCIRRHDGVVAQSHRLRQFRQLHPADLTAQIQHHIPPGVPVTFSNSSHFSPFTRSTAAMTASSHGRASSNRLAPRCFRHRISAGVVPALAHRVIGARSHKTPDVNDRRGYAGRSMNFLSRNDSKLSDRCGLRDGGAARLAEAAGWRERPE